MNHIHYLAHRADNPIGQLTMARPDDVPDDGRNTLISGHALMARCPPPAPLRPFIDNPVNAELSDAEKHTLAKLWGLSDSLPDVNERDLPIIKAWVKLSEDTRFARLSAEDFQDLKHQLIDTVECFR